ncbi:MAG: hypothetical protein HFF67_07365 [Oscillospiraceae bacterium]|nr:hypothetical protein [Oscillospiraceae bacterium]
MKKMQILFVLAAVLLLTGSGGLLTGCQSGGPAVLEGPPIRKEDLLERRLFVQPNTSMYDDKVRTVDDEEFFNQVVDLCAGAEPFRPFVFPYESKAGGPRTANFFLVGAADEYAFSFGDVERQLDFGFVHRDKPLLYVGKASVTKEGIYNSYKNEWAWFYTLPASNYAALYNLIEMYGGGEVIDKGQWW